MLHMIVIARGLCTDQAGRKKSWEMKDPRPVQCAVLRLRLRSDGAEGRGDVERSAEGELPLDHRRIERSSGEGPAWAASNSARLRRPR